MTATPFARCAYCQHPHSCETGALTCIAPDIDVRRDGETREDQLVRMGMAVVNRLLFEQETGLAPATRAGGSA